MTAYKISSACRPLIFLALLFMLSGCTEIEYMSHVVKTSMPRGNETAPAPSGSSQGSFKVGGPYKVEGQWYYPKEQYDLVETGLASWYGPGFNGHRTASGEIYHSNELTAAHRTLQMPSLVRVTNLDNGRSIVVRVNDRGPYRRGRIMDVSSKAADLLGMKGSGTAKVRLQVLSEESMRLAQLAKNGVATRGYETAMMEGQQAGPAPAGPYEVASVEPVSRQAIEPPVPVPGHLDHGAFYPDPVITHMPVTPTNIYVQAGAFTLAYNAEHLRDKLQAYKTAKVEETTIGGQHFYRVRLGPVTSVDEADRLLDRILRDGNSKAIIVVE